ASIAQLVGGGRPVRCGGNIALRARGVERRDDRLADPKVLVLWRGARLRKHRGRVVLQQTDLGDLTLQRVEGSRTKAELAKVLEDRRAGFGSSAGDNNEGLEQLLIQLVTGSAGAVGRAQEHLIEIATAECAFRA